MIGASVSPQVYGCNPLGNIYPTGGVRYTGADMDVHSIRRANLRLAIRTKCEGNQRRFAAAIGRSPTYVHRLLLPANDPHAKNLGEELARELERILALPRLWFDQPQPKAPTPSVAVNADRPRVVRYDSDRQANTESLREAAAGAISNTGRAADALPALGRVPLLSWASAGQALRAPIVADSAMAPASVPTSTAAFALTVHGDTMAPDFPDGCTIIVEPDRAAHDGDYVVARNPAWREATFGRYVLVAGVAYLKPINPAYRQVEFDPGTEIAGVVVEMRLVRTF